MSECREKSTCTVCNQNAVKTVTDFGLQPPANRFIFQKTAENEQEIYPLALGHCINCHTIQLGRRMPMQAMKPRYSWLQYNEPEQHLDDVALHLSKLPGVGPSSRMLGLTYKDQSTLDRLAKLGLPAGTCYTAEEFNIFNSPCLNVRESQEKVDLLIARHVVEHAENATALILMLKELIAPNGYLVLELPDSEKILRAKNYAFIWEEHISYFTEHSLVLLAKSVGAKLAWTARYPYDFEDSLMLALQWPLETNHYVEKSKLDVENLLQEFNQEFAESKMQWRKILQNYREQGHKVAVFGAGHLAVKWINFLELSDLLECVIDDHPNKVGMCMPGSRLPILPSNTLYDRNIKVCISTLSPESEKKVRGKHARYFEEGGIFISAFKSMEHLC